MKEHKAFFKMDPVALLEYLGFPGETRIVHIQTVRYGTDMKIYIEIENPELRELKLGEDPPEIFPVIDRVDGDPCVISWGQE